MTARSGADRPEGLSSADLPRRQQLLEAWAAAHYGTDAIVANLAPMPGHAGISFGFDVVVGSHRDPLVVRVPPSGVRRRGNSDVLRQVPLLQAVRAEGVPVPAVRWWGDDEKWFGVPFMIVERLPGRSIDRWHDDAQEGIDSGTLHRVFEQAVRALAAIHHIPWEKRLPDWAQPRSLTAEIEAWRPTLLKAEDPYWTEPALTLRGLLLDTLPTEPVPGLVHGDFYTNNWVVESNQLQAIVDWEIAGIGPSLLDLGWLCMMHDPESWGPAKSAVLDLAPGPDEIKMMYETASRPVRDLSWYRALAAWRLGAIIAFNVRLHRSGRRPDPTWEILGAAFPHLIRRACRLLGA